MMATKRKVAKKLEPRKRKAGAPPSVQVAENTDDVRRLLKLLRNIGKPIGVRMAALQSLGAAAFSVANFESVNADYIAALRDVSTDSHEQLRRRALGILMRNKDGFAQKKLLNGLKDPAKALLPPEKALQLLGNDVHAEAYAAARAIVKKPPNKEAKREALRLLAADARSAPLFEKVLRDKKELRENRQLAASALHSLNPEKLQQQALKILKDKKDYSDIKATSLTALEQFGDDAALGKDKVLMQSVTRFGAAKAPAKYKQTARRFLSKYGR
ncbi:hypothetical protein [Bradyrhizobium cajani]|uniref:HEAT repeat domain-containing protein n=1 Tax=Bradyrhizobium cajani TaxID=1928661 RepID=A0A844T7M6_9BRAD|nr:hypothetical protein [Bradyrhizobium cajani]MCP3371211.1 hypothetical protein [Bradyrhizobium cajani]MVT72409.1 hypothetical protein [Bradyrhizobium cajani]